MPDARRHARGVALAFDPLPPHRGALETGERVPVEGPPAD